MAGTSTQLTLKVAAINATSRVFRNIASSAMGVTKSIAKWGSVAAVAAGGAFAATVNKLGTLSDVAQSAGAGTEELTKLGAALNMIGVKTNSPEQLAVAFQRMSKATGEVGVEGFYNVLKVVSKLPSMQDRATASLQVFGRAGLAFMPVIERVARDGEFAIQDLVAAMPGISQSAADAGDAAADSLGVIGKAATKVWNEGIGKVAQLIDTQFTGGVRTAALVCAAQMEYFAKAAWAYIKPFITDTKAAFLQLAEWISRVMNNAMTVIGGIIVTAAENFAARVQGLYSNLVDGAEMLIAQLTGNHAVENMVMDRILKREKDVAKTTADNWEQTFKVFEDQLKWGLGEGPLGNVDLSALQAQRDVAIETAKKAGEAYAKAAVTIGAADRAQLGALGAGAGSAQKNVNPEALLGGTYKAVTFALRAGYATAQEKIAKGVDKIASLLKDVKDNTAETADNLDFDVIGG
ncbi:MAG: hypothetical protein IJL17_02175 [Kiritimatiellae bacterium]|nr:hypothetical protein [Kiritimatiellia bacterium]